MTEQQMVDGYPLRLDRGYDPATHTWVQPVGPGRLRVGLDALTADTYGALAQLVMAEVGTPVGRGEPFGSLEAAKFVGPLTSPVSGLVVAVNPAVLDDPELAMREPYDDGWLVEIDATAYRSEADLLVAGDTAAGWFAAEVAGHRAQGLVGE